MAKIAIITSYPKFVYFVDEIRDDYPDDQLILYFCSDESSIPTSIAQAENDGCDAIVTGVFTYDKLYGHTSLPIVNVEASYSDVISAWAKIVEKGLHPKRTFIFFRDQNPILMEKELASKLSAVFSTEVHICIFRGKQDYESTLKKLQIDPVSDMVIAGEHSIEICRSLGYPNEFLQFSINTMNTGIQEAIHISNNIFLERIKNAKLNSILNSSKDGIVYINKMKQIESINSHAMNLLHLDFADTVSLPQLLSKLSFLKEDTILTTGLFINEQLCSTSDGERLVVTTMPLEIDRKIEGVILFLKEVGQIHAIEHKIRTTSGSKGHTAKYRLSDIIGTSPQIIEAKRLAKRFGMFDGSVLIQGETGTGKELFAHAIHNESIRANGPFYAINCAALPINILESELFGYSEGSFTGAKKTGKPGIFELAHGGTLFLDEIGEMDLSCQSKLLRAIQEHEIRRVGDDKIIPIDVRIITATNRNMYEEVRRGTFREDLLYRINVMSLTTPSLRQRPEDIFLLLDHFINEFSNKYNIPSHFQFAESAIAYLKNYTWNGNIRELRNFAERIFVYGYDENLVTESMVKTLLSAEDHFSHYSQPRSAQNHANSDPASPEALPSISEGTIEQMETQMILDAIARFNGNKTKAAEYLGVSRTLIWRRLNKMDKPNV